MDAVMSSYGRDQKLRNSNSISPVGYTEQPCLVWQDAIGWQEFWMVSRGCWLKGPRSHVRKCKPSPTLIHTTEEPPLQNRTQRAQSHRAQWVPDSAVRWAAPKKGMGEAACVSCFAFSEDHSVPFTESCEPSSCGEPSLLAL